MVLSNYKMHTDSNTEFQNLIPVITSNVSSNRIKIQEILLILQLETDYFSKLFISEMLHSKQWHYSLHRDFQNCYSTRRSLTRFFKLQLQFQLQFYNSNTTYIHPCSIYIYTCAHYTTHPSREFSIQKSNSTCRRQRALRVLQIPEILRIEGKEIF